MKKIKKLHQNSTDSLTKKLALKTKIRAKVRKRMIRELETFKQRLEEIVSKANSLKSEIDQFNPRFIQFQPHTKDRWSGTISELIEELNNFYDETKSKFSSKQSTNKTEEQALT